MSDYSRLGKLSRDGASRHHRVGRLRIDGVSSAMQEAIQNAYLAGKQQWPDLAHPTPEAFTRHVLHLAPSEANVQQHGIELFLAFCCGSNDGVAVRTLHQAYHRELDEHLNRAGFDETTRQDVLQQLMMHLCAGTHPRVLTYVGRASLCSWLKVATLRFAINMKPRIPVARSDVGELAMAHMVDEALSPELNLAIEGARPLFQAGLARAMALLSERDTTLLRLFVVEGVSNESIAKLYGVHRATSARWLADIKRRILDEVQRTVTREFGLHSSEFQSLAYLIRSELHLSLGCLFGAA